jgi:hypothetical protein
MLLNPSERQSHLKTFKTTFEAQPEVCSADSVRIIFLSALGITLVRNKVIFDTKRLGLIHSIQAKLRVT